MKYYYIYRYTSYCDACNNAYHSIGSTTGGHVYLAVLNREGKCHRCMEGELEKYRYNQSSSKIVPVICDWGDWSGGDRWILIEQNVEKWKCFDAIFQRVFPVRMFSNYNNLSRSRMNYKEREVCEIIDGIPHKYRINHTAVLVSTNDPDPTLSVRKNLTLEQVFDETLNRKINDEKDEKLSILIDQLAVVTSRLELIENYIQTVKK